MFTQVLSETPPPDHEATCGCLPGLRCAIAVLLAVSSFAVVLVPVARATSGVVSVFPSPGTRYSEPQTEISFRGIPANQIGQLTVTGSQSGTHSGTIEADSDGDGGSFVPSTPFTAGETVSVTTGLNVLGGKNGSFSFAIANPVGPIGYGALPLVKAVPGGVQSYRTAPGLHPAAVDVTADAAPASQGDIFVAPQFGPTQDGPMILDPQGNLIWFLPSPVQENRLITNFRVQYLHGQPVLTWWQGNTNAGHGRGEGVIYNQQYQPVATVRAGNGVDMGLHAFLVTNQGDAYFTASWRVRVPRIRQPVIDSVIQEVDIKTGLVLFQWNALDHVPLSQSYFAAGQTGANYDPYHANSVSLDTDGNLIVSMRNTSAVYKIDHQTGQIMWTLGGKASSFRMGAGTPTWGQHDAVVHPGEQMTIFDDGGGPPRVRPYSRGIRVRLDVTRKTATLIKEYDHGQPLASNFEGSLQPLSDGDVFSGWGQQPYFSEDDASGRQIFDAHFAEPTGTYRAYRFPWSGQPPISQLGAALAPAGNGAIDLYASWNGATNVVSWRVLGGAEPNALAPVAGKAKSGFETEIPVNADLPYFEVQALDSAGHVLGTSSVQHTPAHIAVFGASAFVAPGGTGGLPVACDEPRPCRVAATITEGRTVIARTGAETISEDTGGVLYFRLSPTGDGALAHARGDRLPVQVSARDASGTSATATLRLLAFHTTGPAPHHATTNSSTLQIIGSTDFVSASGVGGILAGCMATTTSCRTVTTVSVGKTVIAHTGPEYVGANELGYLIFTLTPAGRTLLAHAHGNQLGAQVTITDPRATATADVGLVAFK